MYKLLGSVLLVTITQMFATAIAAAEFDDLKNTFSGRITPEAVEKFIAEHPPGTIKKLTIASDGGDGYAGIKFGHWVRKNGLDVHVYMICMSACANFVFPAGNKKTIGPKSLVLWHGSAEQKNLRELQTKYERLLLKAHRSLSTLDADDRLFLEENEKFFESALVMRDLQARFFDEIQINEYITRLGQEPINLGIDSWTTTVKVMEKFGINNVEAPANYGSPAYLRSIPLAGWFFKGKFLTFDLDVLGHVRRVEP
jgi:hypothetical protein